MTEVTPHDGPPEEETGPSEDVGLTREDQESLEEPEAEARPVSYSGTDFDVEGLVRRLRRGDIVIPRFGDEAVEIETDRFQRSFVWRRPQMDRFIESLLLEYPIPGIILVQQVDKRYLVLDGQQRLNTLAEFYRGMHREREFSLVNVADRFRGLTYETLPPELRRTLDNTFIQATIVKTDGSTGSLDAVYQVFERLNSGGTQLTPHEIRVALYAGDFVALLGRLNDEPAWRKLYGNKSPRLRDQELVLRILALYVSAATYRRPLKTFLNDFVGEYRDTTKFPVDPIVQRFRTAAHLLEAGPERRALRWAGNRAVNAALAEAVFVGLMRRLDLGDDEPTPEAVTAAVERLQGNERLANAVTRATADEESVRTRLAITTREFASI
ncbi:DUF262 domain-containing protein [Micromonospora purpureochromogenes]|uniref:DUF262 domain-containing protein n=1 Tax=Micromonospora purpureochromogenes TaxID=47872 RepID=UPI003323C4BA